MEVAIVSDKLCSISLEHHLAIPTMNQLLAIITMNYYVDGAS